MISPAGDFVALMLGIGAILVGLYRVYRRVDGWNDAAKIAATNTTLIGEIRESVRTIEGQVTTNGGESLKDRVITVGEQMTVHAHKGDTRHQRIDWRLDQIENHLGLTSEDP